MPEMIEIIPVGKINAVVDCPKSKGFTNRALLVAALADGTSRLSNALLSDDTRHMMAGLAAFGAGMDVSGNSVTVRGVNGRPNSPSEPLYVGNSGTTARFLTAFAALAGKTVIDGDERMRERPIEDLAVALRAAGAMVETANGFPPVTVSGGKLSGSVVSLSGRTSSQFLSALLMVAPFSKSGMVIEITDELTSKPFVDMTISVMRTFGAHVSASGYKSFAVSNKAYNARDYFIEGDAANASYFFAAAAVTGGTVKVVGINPHSLQGELGFVDLLREMGCSVRKGNDWIEVSGGTLSGITVDMNSMPDVVQTLSVVAAFAKTKTRITNVANLRIKETNRLAALSIELKKIGAEVKEYDDGLEIIPKRVHSAAIGTYNDHRMAMSFAVAGLAVPGIRIENPACVSKTFPDFFAELQKLKSRNIVLIGYRSTGKSSVAELLGKLLARPVIETDDLVEKKESDSVRSIVEKKGWAYFRKLEYEAIMEASTHSGSVISTGGGAVMDERNALLLRKNGVFVLLKASIPAIIERLTANERPALNGVSSTEEVAKVLGEREPVYERLADITVDTTKNSVSESVSIIFRQLKSLGVL